jgi:hypothetical protein
MGISRGREREKRGRLSGLDFLCDFLTLCCTLSTCSLRLLSEFKPYIGYLHCKSGALLGIWPAAERICTRALWNWIALSWQRAPGCWISNLSHSRGQRISLSHMGCLHPAAKRFLRSLLQKRVRRTVSFQHLRATGAGLQINAYSNCLNLLKED